MRLGNHASVRKASRNKVVSSNLRFLCERLAELLDPDAAFVSSACFVLDPLTALREYRALANNFIESNGRNPSPAAMKDAAVRSLAAIQTTPEVQHWYPRAYDQAVVNLKDLVTASGTKKPVAPMKGVLTRTSPIGPDELRAQMDAEPTFRAKLVDAVILSRDATERREFQQLDDHMKIIAAILWSAGRTPQHLALSVADIVAEAKGHAAAVSAVREALAGTHRQYSVAMKVPGTSRLTRAMEHHCRTTGSLRWPLSGENPLDSVDGALLLVDIQATDHFHAAHRASRRAQRLLDQYRAKHRVHHFELSHVSLVLDEEGQSVTAVMAPKRETPKRPVPLRKRPDPRIQQSLRYAALAREEDSPVIQILHCWIALESLARGSGVPKNPYPLLKAWLPPMLALHAVRLGLVDSWIRAMRCGRTSQNKDGWLALEVWLGTTRQGHYLPDIDKWTDVLRCTAPEDAPLEPESPTEVAAWHLRELLPSLTPNARFGIESWQFFLASGPRLEQWCHAVQRGVLAAIGRMYALRNSAVHTGLEHDESVEPLATAAHLTVDLMHEILPALFSPGQPPWRAMERLVVHGDGLRDAWEADPGPAQFVTHSLTRP